MTAAATPSSWMWTAAATVVMLFCGCSSASMGDPSTPGKPQQRPASTNEPPVANAHFVGTWRLEPGDDLIRAAQKLRTKVPSMQLDAHPDGTFDLYGTAGDKSFEVSGEWFATGNKVTLRAKEVSGDSPILQSEREPRAGTLSEDGDTFTDDGGWVWKRVKK
jgi:hypothetical protein